MDWTMWGAIGELAGAIAVVVSLIYVGGQIKQSATVARLAALQD